MVHLLVATFSPSCAALNLRQTICDYRRELDGDIFDTSYIIKIIGYYNFCEDDSILSHLKKSVIVVIQLS